MTRIFSQKLCVARARMMKIIKIMKIIKMKMIKMKMIKMKMKIIKMKIVVKILIMALKTLKTTVVKLIPKILVGAADMMTRISSQKSCVARVKT